MKYILIYLKCFLLTSCFEYKDYPMELKEGNYFSIDEIKKLTINVDSKTSIIKKIGGPFEMTNDDQTEQWIYFMARSKKTVFLLNDYEELYLKRFVLTFNNENILISVEEN